MLLKMFNSLSKINKYPRSMKLLFKNQLATAPTSNLQISDEVSKCLEIGGPVVALESTIITHGMPYPDNLRTAFEVEEIVRNHNAVPATVGIINGKTYVGMRELELKILASSENSVKVSRRDLPYVLSRGLTGGTTVSSTMILAHKVGINIFVTGGIGGVHRFGETSMDISADLMELSRTPMTVISAGIKSILDIERTLEYLETQGVCVTTFGQSKEFPAFFTPNSGYFAPWNVGTISEAADLIACRDALQLQSGILVAVPIPEDQAADGELTEKAISLALKDAQDHNISGKDVTPFLLRRVNELSGGASLRANIALIKNNAKIGSLIAVELARIQGNFKKPSNSQNGVKKVCTEHSERSPSEKEFSLHQDNPVYCERPMQTSST